MNGWGWGGVNDVSGYSSEQILATSHFRFYRSLGGDSTSQARRQFASDTAIYLILRAVGQLTPVSNPPAGLLGPQQWEQELETATRSCGPALIRRKPMRAAPTAR